MKEPDFEKKPYFDRLMKLVQQGLLEEVLFQIYSETWELNIILADEATLIMRDLNGVRNEKTMGLIKFGNFRIIIDLRRVDFQ